MCYSVVQCDYRGAWRYSSGREVGLAWPFIPDPIFTRSVIVHLGMGSLSRQIRDTHGRYIQDLSLALSHADMASTLFHETLCSAPSPLPTAVRQCPALFVSRRVFYQPLPCSRLYWAHYDRPPLDGGSQSIASVCLSGLLGTYPEGPSIKGILVTVMRNAPVLDESRLTLSCSSRPCFQGLPDRPPYPITWLSLTPAKTLGSAPWRR